jgi:heterodisulfide reductase subunit B2
VRYALFVGCTIPERVPEYERSARLVLRRLGVELVDLDFGCCGYPARHASREAHLVLAEHNLALAASRGLDLLALCQCCYGSLRNAQRTLARDRGRRPRAVERRPVVRHLLEVLAREVGLEAIAALVRSPLEGLRVATHYGCHALRPSDVVELDNPHAPTVFERLVAVTGARPVDWPRRLDCCGAPIADSNPVLADRIRAGKVADAREAGADALCTACPFCQRRFSDGPAGSPPSLPSILYTQLLGLALGEPWRALGLPGPHPLTCSR